MGCSQAGEGTVEHHCGCITLAQMSENYWKNWLYCVVTGDTYQSTPDVVLAPGPLIWKTPRSPESAFICQGCTGRSYPGSLLPSIAPTAAAVCSAAPKESLCFISCMDGPSWLERQHHGSTMCPILFNLFFIMRNFRHMSNAILNLDPYSRCLQNCKLCETVGFALCLFDCCCCCSSL